MSDLSDVINKIIPADGRHLTEFIPKECVSLTVTSPPYRNAIDYETHRNGNGDQRYRGNAIWKDVDSYLDDMKVIFDQVRIVTKTGGYCCIVIGYEIVKTEIIPLPSLLLAKLLNEQQGIDADERWVLREEIIWNKVTAGRNGAGNRFGSTILNPYPTYYHANVMHEYIFVLSKGQHRIEREEARKKMVTLGMTDEMKREIANSTWHIPPTEWTIAPVPPRKKVSGGGLWHPAPFPEQIPWRLITLFSYPNEIVLDPMNGSGTTTKVAKYLDRAFIGVDIAEEYCELARKRLDETPHLSTKLWVKWGSEPHPSPEQRKPITDYS
ncbi:MAG: site-specific DNA-methyltransferase [Thaumarchaeota archaeon]|nr:site-specific DNA-methyltransferase [Nitrososphaerota archaeon]